MKFIFAFFLFVLTTKVHAQVDTSRTVERYCMVSAIGKLLSSKVTISVDFGESLSLWKDNRIKDEITGKVKNFNSVIDALNYMGSQGWKYVNSLLLGNGPYVYQYIFRKEFPKEE
jgi:uncharacterized protein YoxC